MNLGSSTTKIQPVKFRVDTGVPHQVVLTHDGNHGVIQVDGEEKSYVTSRHFSERLDLVDVLYVGGLNADEHANRIPLEMWSTSHSVGFVGCLQDLLLNGVRVNLVGLSRDQEVMGIVEHCKRLEPQCPSRPCLHGGVCRDGWNRFVCDCSSTGYRGPICRIGKRCRWLL